MIQLQTKNENDKLLVSFLNRYYFKSFQQKNKNKSIELFLKGDCPSKCSYCYLQRHLNDLYPREYDKEDIILQNLDAFLNFYIENNFQCGLELYSGRLFATDFGIKVLELLYNKFVQQNVYRPQHITIPDDMQFLLNDKLTQEIRDYIYKFYEIDIPVGFSASVDGKENDYLRFGLKTDEFYNKLYAFINEFDFGSHPMVSAYGIKSWKENYMWWKQFLGNKFYTRLMLLEVRDNNWNGPQIEEYLSLINDAYDQAYQDLGGLSPNFINFIFNKDPFGLKNLCSIQLNGEDFENRARGMSCAIQTTLHVRLGDLAIVPCHRLGYPQYVIGRFETNEDNKITGINGQNTTMGISCNALKLTSLPKCTNCIYRFFCMGPCLGSNFESTGDPFYTPNKLCNFFKARITFLLMKMNETGVLHYLQETDNELFTLLSNHFDIIENFHILDRQLFCYMEELIYK